jgi:hypothetical protein
MEPKLSPLRIIVSGPNPERRQAHVPVDHIGVSRSSYNSRQCARPNGSSREAGGGWANSGKCCRQSVVGNHHSRISGKRVAPSHGHRQLVQMAVHHLRRQDQRSPRTGNCLCMDQRRYPDQISHSTRFSGHATGVDRNRIQGTSYSRLESATFTRRRHTRQNHRVYGRFYVEALLLLQRSCEVTASLA